LIIRFNKQRNREGEEEENGGNKTNASRVNSGKRFARLSSPQLQEKKEKNIKKTNSPDKRKKKIFPHSFSFASCCCWLFNCVEKETKEQIKKLKNVGRNDWKKEGPRTRLQPASGCFRFCCVHMHPSLYT
jgi:hypothetical protein